VTRLFAGIAISALCLWLAFRHVPPGFVDTLQHANYLWLIAFPILTIALNVVRATVWRRLLDRQVARADAFWSYSLGFLVNNVLPFRAGEAARIGALTIRSHRSAVEITAAAALERVLDVLMLLAIVLVVLPYISNFSGVSQAAFAAAFVAAAVLAVVVALVAFRTRIDRAVSGLVTAWMPRWSGALLRAWRQLMDAFAVVKNPWAAAEVTLSMAFVWLLTVLMQWTVLLAFQPSADLVDAAVMTVVVSLAGGLPAAPGGIGIQQYAGQQALLIPFPGKYDPAVALAAAVAAHAASYLSGSILGVIALWHLDVPLSSWKKQPASPSPAVVIEHAQPLID